MQISAVGKEYYFLPPVRVSRVIEVLIFLRLNCDIHDVFAFVNFVELLDKNVW